MQSHAELMCFVFKRKKQTVHRKLSWLKGVGVSKNGGLPKIVILHNCKTSDKK
jgi:hypothetical protein